MRTYLLSLVFFLGISLTSFAQQTWNVDKVHSTVKFGVTHLVISTVEGNFRDFDAKLYTKADGSVDKIEADIKTTSVNTDNDQRDNHLRSEDFFASAKFPEMIFLSKNIQKVGQDQYKITGDLTIRGITKSVVLDARNNGTITDPWGSIRTGWSASTKINRFDFGLAWNKAIEAGGLVVGKEVTISINAEFSAKKSLSLK
jgi:polyisoprenoid-binding protein YceI